MGSSPQEVPGISSAGNCDSERIDTGLLPAETVTNKADETLIDSIEERNAFPSSDPDEFSVNDRLQLSATALVKYEHILLVKRLDDDLSRERLATAAHNDELSRLRPIEVDHARLKQANKTKKIILAVCACFAAVGAGFVKHFATGQHTELAAIGFSAICLAALVQLFMALLDG